MVSKSEELAVAAEGLQEALRTLAIEAWGIGAADPVTGSRLVSIVMDVQEAALVQAQAINAYVLEVSS